jgi:HlyD family secretion protein
MKKRLLAVLAIAIAIAFVVGGVRWWQGRTVRDDGTLVLQGNVDIRQISLAFDGSGRVARVNVEEGQQVKAGMVLATLDTQTLRLQGDQARAQLEVQRQNLLRLRQGARPQEIAQARSRLDAARAEAQRAQRELDRLREIAATTQGRGVSAQDIDRADTAVHTARARVAELQDALRVTELGARAEEVAGAQAQLDASKSTLALLDHQLAQGELKAPADATVRSRLLEPGDMATPQRPVFALALTHPKWIRVFVSEASLGRVRTGMGAEVRTDGQPDHPVRGTVSYIAAVAEFTPKSVQTEELRSSLVYEVRVVVQDEDNRLRLGQPATVTLAVGSAP